MRDFFIKLKLRLVLGPNPYKILYLNKISKKTKPPIDLNSYKMHRELMKLNSSGISYKYNPIYRYFIKPYDIKLKNYYIKKGVYINE